jgi:branched-chain amino acid transport system substrate-binding protein
MLNLMRSFFVISFIVAVSISHRTAEAAEPITIGVLHFESFPYATMMKNSFEMALEAINGKGGIKGRPLALAFADDRGERIAGETAIEELGKDHEAVLIVGGYSSSNTIYTARLANKLDIPFLITTASDDRITQRKWKNVYRMNPPVKEYSKGVEEVLTKKIKPTSMAIIYENSPYGTGGAMHMMWYCRENDIEIRKIIPYHKERASSPYFQNLLKPLQGDPPDAIYMISYLQDAVSLIKKIRELKLDSILIGGAGGFTHPQFATLAEGAADGLLTATLWSHELPYPGAKEYNDQYFQKYSVSPDYHGAEAYSALFVVANALSRAESLRPEGIREALDTTDMETPFGPVKFQSYGKFERQNSLPTTLLRITEGKD